MNVKSFCFSLSILLGSTSLGLAQSAPTLAQDGLQSRIDHLSLSAAENGFELGMLQTLRGVEKTLQARYDYGLGQKIMALPLLRLGAAVTPNPAPRPSTPQTLGQIMADFITDMQRARTSLATAAQAGITPFDLALEDIWFDVNTNGIRDRQEDAIDILGLVVLGPRGYRQFQRENSQSENPKAPLNVRFDTADHAWLSAYTHMLSGVANLFLAFDPAPVLQDLASARTRLTDAPQIANIYDPDELRQRISQLKDEFEAAQARRSKITDVIQPLQDQIRALERKRKDANNDAEKEAFLALANTLRTQIRPLTDDRNQISQDLRLIQNEINAAKAKLEDNDPPMQQFLYQQAASIDLVYVALASIQQQPDPAHIRAAHADWTAMIAHNRTFWDQLQQETDNEREWIPNATQTSVLPVEIPERVADAWQNILADAEAVLDGRLLVPHPLLPPGHGISIPAYVDNPAPLDLTKWVHGVGAYPYAAKGPRITSESWQIFQRITQGNAAGFALFLN